jgi:hypothetical protein
LRRGRSNRCDKSCGPSPLEPSFKVKRDYGHNLAPGSWSPRSRRVQRARSFKGPPFGRRLAQSTWASPALAQFGRPRQPASPGLTSDESRRPGDRPAGSAQFDCGSRIGD